MNVDTFKNKFSETIKFNHKLANYTWFGVGGNAEIFFVPENEMAIQDFLIEKPKELELFTIGAGSITHLANNLEKDLNNECRHI